MNRKIPGTGNNPNRDFRYIECSDKAHFREVFGKIGLIGSSSLPTSGGVMEEKAVIELHDGRLMFGVSFRGDLEGWRRKIMECCNELELIWGKITDKNIILSTGEIISLSNCNFDSF